MLRFVVGVMAGDLSCAVSGLSLGVSGSLVAACSLALLGATTGKTGKRVFLLNNIDMPDSPIPPIEARTKDRGIVTLPSLLASPEEKRAHQLRRFESWL